MRIKNQHIKTVSQEFDDNFNRISYHDELKYRLFLNKNNITNLHIAEFIANILDIEPNVRFTFDFNHVKDSDLANRFNSGTEYDDSPLYSMNSVFEKMRIVDVSLVQCYFGLNDSLARATRLSILFNLLSNPVPRDYVFVEAQKNAKDAKFHWVEKYGIRYFFISIDEDDSQDYFIKEQLWNIGARYSRSDNLVFMDGDVSYCQMDWLGHVENTFKKYKVFQPHSVSYRSFETKTTSTRKYNNEFGLLESYANVHIKTDTPDFGGHTGFDLAMTRDFYNRIGGFWSIYGSGGDWLNMILIDRKNIEWYEGTQVYYLAKDIIKNRNNYIGVPLLPIGCSNLACFHIKHGDLPKRENSYINGDVIINRELSDNDKKKQLLSVIFNNFNEDEIKRLP